MTNLFKIGFGPGEEVSAGLEAMGREPACIDLVINSHFHFDHVGSKALIPNATMVVQRREWDASMDPDIAVRQGFNPRDFDLGHKLRALDLAPRFSLPGADVTTHPAFIDGDGRSPLRTAETRHDEPGSRGS